MGQNLYYNLERRRRSRRKRRMKRRRKRRRRSCFFLGQNSFMKKNKGIT
jgi:hypothetical protein